MVKKVIQVPVDEELLTALDQLSRKQRKARSELIRQACQCYLGQVKSEELDRSYQQGYERLPEEPELGEAQIALGGEVLSKESW
ncbi:MAG: ribbon-helix-helix protein, CopG family [Dehalococcoidales bacterium]|nr:ribbon-helix-helix protein, CopG family [Dehalococcoidales bacterium]